MPTHNIPLAQTVTARGWAKSVGTSAKDAQIINGLVEVSTNPSIGTKTVYVSKRAGSSVSAASIGSGVVIPKYYAGSFAQLSFASDGTVKDNTTSLGDVDGVLDGNGNYVLGDATVSGVVVVAFNTRSNVAGWYLWYNATTNNFPTFTADTHSNTTIDNIGGTGAATTGIYVGQKVSGTGIPADTRVATVSGTSFTITNAATGTATITVTKEAVSKIIDSDYPSDATGGIVALDGYFFTASTKGNIHQSAINDPSSWASADVIAADYSGDSLSFIFKIQNHIAAAGTGGTIQYFANAGNASGSVLSSAEHLNITGLVLEHHPLQLGSVFYVLASSSMSGGKGLYSITGINSYNRISDDNWSSLIQDLSLDLLSPAIIGNKNVILLHSSSASPCICFDPSTGEFTLIQVASAITSSFGGFFTRASSSDILAWASGNTWTDEGVAYTLTIQTEPQDMAGGASTTDNQAVLLADTESSGTASLDTSDDDYANWVSKGTFDMTAQRKEVWALGWHRGPRAYRIQHSANTGFRGQILRIGHTPSRP